MRLKNTVAAALAAIMLFPSAEAVKAEDIPIISIKKDYDISDSVELYEDFDYSDPQHISDELLLGMWDAETESWVPQYNSVVIRNNLPYPQMADKPLIDYSSSPELREVEEAVKVCDGDYAKPKALLLNYYRNKFKNFNKDISATGNSLTSNAYAYNYYSQKASLIQLFDMEPETTSYTVDLTSQVSSVVNSTSTTMLCLIFSAMEIDGQSAFIYSNESEYKPFITADLSDGSTRTIYPDYDLTIKGGAASSVNFPEEEALEASERHNPDTANDDFSAKTIMQFDFGFVPDGTKVLAARLEFTGYTDKEEGKKKMVLSQHSDISLVEESGVTWSAFPEIGISYNTSPGEMVTEYGFSGLSHAIELAKRYLYDKKEIYAYHAMRYLLNAHIQFDGKPFTMSPISPLLSQGSGTANNLANSVYCLIFSEHMTPEAFGMMLKSVYNHCEWLTEGWRHGLLTNNHATYYNQGFSALVTLFPEFDKADDECVLDPDDTSFFDGGRGGWIPCLQRRVVFKAKDLTLGDTAGKEASIGYNREAFRNSAAVMQYAIEADFAEFLPDEYYDTMAKAALYFMHGTAPGYYDWNTGDSYGATANFIQRPTIKQTIDALKMKLEEDSDKDSEAYLTRKSQYEQLLYAYTGGEQGTMPEFESILYPISRNLVLRDGWKRSAVGATMLNNNGNVHGHFDDLSVIITAYGSELLADSGKPVYTRNDPTRAWQLSTRAHNTIEINDTTQKGYMSNNWEVVKGPWNENIILPFRDSHGMTTSERTSVFGMEREENADIKAMIDSRNYNDENLVKIYELDDELALEGENYPENPNFQGRFLECELTDAYDYSKAETYSNINVVYYDDGDVLGNGKIEYKAPDNAHSRSILFLKGNVLPHFFIVTDRVAPVNDNNGVNKYSQGWHFRNDAEITLDEVTGETRTHFSGANIAVVPVMGQEIATEAEIKTGLYTSGDHIPAEYVTYTKHSDKPTTFNTVLFPMAAGEDFGIKAEYLPIEGITEGDASAFVFDVTDPKTKKTVKGTYYNVHNPEMKKDVKLKEYLTDSRLLYADKSDDIYTTAILADATYLRTDDDAYLIKATENISNMSVEWRGTGLYISTTHTDSGESEYVNLSSLTILNQRKTRNVYLNGEDIAYKTSGNYIYFGDEPIIEGEDDSGEGGTSTGKDEVQKPSNNHGTGGGGGGGGSSAPDKDEVKEDKKEETKEDIKEENKETAEVKESFKKELEGHWGRNEIESLIRDGVVNGVSESSLGLRDLVTRAQFAAMLVRALKLETVKYSGEFGDVKSGDWYADVIATVKNTGIMNGDENGNVNPDSVLTREQMAKMAVLALEKIKEIKKGEGEMPSLEDEDKISPWAKEYVSSAFSMGIMNGVANNRFAPLENVSREQAMVLVYRIMNKKQPEGLTI